MGEDRLWIRAVVGALLGAALLAAAWLVLVWQPEAADRPQKTPKPSSEAAPSPTPDKAGELARRLADMAGWPSAGRRFTTDSQTPLVLLRKESQVVYVQDNQIRYDWLDGTNYQNIPLSFPSARSGYVWRSGAIAYIGLPVKSGESETAGDWYVLQVAPGVSNPLKRLGRLPIAPDMVKAVSFADGPQGALFLVENEKENEYKEYWISSEGKGPLYVSDSSYEASRAAALAAERQQLDKLAFDSVRRLETTGGQLLYALQDARGLVLYEELATGPTVYRLSGYALNQARPVSPRTTLAGSAGSTAYLLNVQPSSGAGSRTLLLRSGGPVWLGDGGRLQEPGWELFDDWNFVRLSETHVETVAVEPARGSAQGAEAAPLQLRYDALELGGAAEVVRSLSLLTGEFGEERRYLSLYDLLNRTSGEQDALWMKELPEGRSVAAAGAAAPEGELSVPFPAQPEATPGVPEELQGALDAVDRAGSGEATTHTVRRIDGRWYVLTGSRLEAWDREQGLTRIAELPVSVRCTEGSYRTCSTALDFTRSGGYWYVADTFGDRVVKADAAGRLKAEAELRLPSALSWNAGGELLAEGLGGRSRLSRELTVLGHTAPAPAVDASALTMQELLIDSDSYYEDGRGRRWAFRTDRLLVWDEKQMMLRSIYTGPANNAAVRVRLLPYRQQLLLVYDDRILFFDANGKWLKQMTLPPPATGEPQSMGDTGSCALDGGSGVLYMQRGAQVLRIDLEQGSAAELFAQTRASFGKLLYEAGALYITLQPAGGYAAPDALTELLRIDPATAAVQRYRAPAGYRSEALTAEAELVLEAPRLAAGGNGQLTRLLVPLQSLK
ncbi:hypothetical protein B5M42_009755 [Paenibacillus athensensis]|uniref:Uncharacterized protein n=1 Tax=Paenibacillus athensensis TaxID=1967502 RepID=A0A4Y8Q9N7_9BACL|nr:hypothetical protein [Paenibacillus athensensis]MCD1259122.1 hypothetical protein [Paenibacillus athensensis]